MEKYIVPLTSSTQNPKPPRRQQWKRSLSELTGKFVPQYRHDLSHLLMQSVSQIGDFAHSYHINGVPCGTHVSWFVSGSYNENPCPLKKHGVSSVEFDTKGIYLASASKLGCLTVHDFETLYCQANGESTSLMEDETKHLLHIFTQRQIDVVRWNLANQDEVACTSTRSSELQIYDIGYISSEPVEVLRLKSTANVHGHGVHKGFGDIAFTSVEDSRVLASDTQGAINIWDRRMSDLPCLELSSNSNTALNSIQLNPENQIICGASKNGTIYMWDIRGGRSAAAFQSHKECFWVGDGSGVPNSRSILHFSNSPLISMKLSSMLDKIGSLKAQSNIYSKEIHSININPSCSYHLGFHLDDGWSGVFDMKSLKVTHIHCPPPPWLDDPNYSADISFLRKPTWLPTSSVYVVGSSYNNGIHLLDFYPDSSSPCHVDYIDDVTTSSKEKVPRKQNRFLSLSDCVTACASHPLNSTLIAGTKNSSLLLISQRQHSYREEDNCFHKP